MLPTIKRGKLPQKPPLQFSLLWILAGLAFVSFLFATVATKGLAIFVVIVLAVLSPMFVLAYIAALDLRNKTSGPSDQPLASMQNDPLGIERENRLPSPRIMETRNATNCERVDHPRTRQAGQ